jgi:chromosome partitioning protein
MALLYKTFPAYSCYPRLSSWRFSVPERIGLQAISAIKASNLVLIPVQPSPYDIWAASDLVDLVKQRIEMTDGRLKAAFVVSRAIKNTKIGAEIREALEGYGLPVLAARVTQSVAYPSTAAAGTTVLDAEPNSNAAQEIRGLADEVLALLK